MNVHAAALVTTALLAIAAPPAMAHVVTFAGSLSTAGEAVLNPVSQGTGTVTVLFDDDNFTMSVNVSFAGLSGTTSAAHIHCCTGTAGTGSAGVATPVPTFPGFPLGVTSGSYSQSFDLTQASSWNPAFVTANGGTVNSAFAAFSTGLNAGKTYFNVHTSLAGGGEIRAFLAPVPEPETYALMLAGLGLLGFAVRRRQLG